MFDKPLPASAAKPKSGSTHFPRTSAYLRREAARMEQQTAIVAAQMARNIWKGMK